MDDEIHDDEGQYFGLLGPCQSSDGVVLDDTFETASNPGGLFGLRYPYNNVADTIDTGIDGQLIGDYAPIV